MSRCSRARQSSWAGPARRVACAAAAALAPAATTAAAASAAPHDVADMDITELATVRVSPFDVSAGLDSGYRASNAVSSSRFDAPIRELPFAVQSFTDAFIRDQKPVTVFDVARYSPGVTYRSNDFNEGNANVAIRGFAVSSTPGNVQILRDGFHGPSILDFTNIARVEVVKGPASFLYGQVAPGGIVNVITKRPQPQFAATAGATYGAYGQHRVELNVTGPAARALFFRIAASYDRDIDYWKPYDAHAWDIAPSLLWQPNERLSVSLGYERFARRESPQLMQKPGYGTQAGIVPTADDPNRSGVDVPGLPDTWNSMSHTDYRDSDTDSLNAWVDYEAGPHWHLRAGYAHVAYEIDALFSGNLGMANNTTFLQGRRVRQQVYGNHGDTLQTEGVGRYRFGGASLRLLLGAQYVRRGFDNRAAQAPNDPALGSDPSASPLPLWDLQDPSTWNRDLSVAPSTLTAEAVDRHTRFTDRSVYVGTTFGFFDDRLLVLAGWRRTATHSRVTDVLAGSTGTVTSGSAATPQYGLLYKLTPALSPFVSYAESFVPGSQILLHPDGSTSAAVATRGRGVDAGVKFGLPGGRISGTLTYYDIRNRNIVSDLARTDAFGAVTIYNVQAGEQRSRGLELDTTLKLGPHWQAYLSYSRMHARITEFTGRDAELLALDPSTLDAAEQANYKNARRFHGAPLQMSAPHLANVWARYDVAAGGAAGAYIGFGANLVREQTLLPDSPASARQSYTLVNALLGYSWSAAGRRISVELMGKNLADEHYRPSQSTRSRPREWLLTLRAGL